jgi:RimJ/RimL family protein N-acetyltransferase
MTKMPVLETKRTSIRPFVLDDLEAVHQLLDVELSDGNSTSSDDDTMAERRRWLQWTILNYEQLAKLHQPPYGDRAVIQKSTGRLIGACGYVPLLNAFEKLPYFAASGQDRQSVWVTTELGLYYAISPGCQRRGYATEAAQGLIAYAFERLRAKRVIATTDHDNRGSIGVMKKLGMRIETNPHPEPPWLQVVGILENDR